jgi:membrane-associated protein
MAAPPARSAPGVSRLRQRAGAGACANRARYDRGVTGLSDRILGLPGWLVLVVAGLTVFAEDALFVGFVLPGETAAFLAGAAAKIGHASLVGVIIVVIVAAIVGDTIGYEIGATWAPGCCACRCSTRHKRLDDAQDFLARCGGSAVFLGRWNAFFRAVMPFLAGTSRMH